jgi:hypothetical protein
MNAISKIRTVLPAIGQTVYLHDNVFPMTVRDIHFKDNSFLVEVACRDADPKRTWKFTPDVLRAA